MPSESDTAAVEHYLSANRKDAVKLFWEEPFTRSVLRSAIRSLSKACHSSLTVLDLGCGVGDGLTLLSDTAKESFDPPPQISYFGMDKSAQMIDAARHLWSTSPLAPTFVQDDFRLGVPGRPFHLYVSFGVPFSYLSPAGLLTTLKSICAVVRRSQSAAVLIVDVLGRYSIEWPVHWDKAEWEYRMSFFKCDGEPPSVRMTFYDAQVLRKLILRAAADTGCTINAMRMFDRSIMVGRHTSTRQYNPSIPPYRHLVNSLLSSTTETPLELLLIPTELKSAPRRILRFFKSFGKRWNGRVRQAIDCVRLGFENSRPSVRSGRPTGFSWRKHLEQALADDLRLIEYESQKGLGVGHSLVAMVCVN